MSKMSEEELEIKLEDIIEDLLEHYHEYHNDVDHVDDGSSNAHSKIMSLIHSYTQEKCREARIDELNRLMDYTDENEIVCVCEQASVQVCDHNWSLCHTARERIAGLKAQQERFGDS